MQETQETQVQSLGWENPLEEEMAVHFSIHAWKIPQTEEPGGIQSTGLQRTNGTKGLNDNSNNSSKHIKDSDNSSALLTNTTETALLTNE